MSTVSSPQAGAGEPEAAGYAVALERVSVRYRVPRERIRTFKEYAIRRITRRLAYNDFWALKGVTFTIPPGEAFGIVGANGAGKSTLLKVVARVLRPIEGRVRVRGRVAPLLELSLGFDNELSGRENIFLSGTMLGFTRRDLRARLDRMIAFAGLEPFIDAPLRTYSSGMVARLAFSVATDVQPETLLVDEVLAVGDAEFRKRSTERLRAVQASGTTILLVSHQMELVTSLCRRAVWLERGEVKAVGPAAEVTAAYQPSAE